VPDSISRVKEVHFPGGTVQKNTYDARGNITRVEVGSYVQEFAHDLNNNVVEVRHGGDVVASTEYDGLDRPISVTRKTGTQEDRETFTYFTGGQPKSHVISDERFGIVREWIYDSIDEAGRPRRMNMLGNTIQPSLEYVYAPGSLDVTRPRVTTRRTWNAAGFDTGYQDSVLNKVIHPDASGRVRRVDLGEEGATYSTFTDYDDLDHALATWDNLGTVFTMRSRADGSLLGLTNALGHGTTFEQTSLGEPAVRRRADGMEVRHEYDAARNPRYAGDPSAGFHYTFDADYRLKEVALRNGAKLVFGDFTPRNLPQTITTPGGTKTMRYDLQGRVIDETVTHEGTTYESQATYDALNRARVETYRQDSGGMNTATFDYDKAGPLLQASFEEDGREYAVHYEYYDDATRKSIAYPSGPHVIEERDSSGRLTGVSDVNGNIISASAWQGNLQPRTVRLGATLGVANQYDTRGRLTASRVVRSASGEVAVHLRYEYDAANNLLTRQFLHRAGRADNFFYDLGERLSIARMGMIPTVDGQYTVPLYERGYGYDQDGLDLLVSSGTTNLGIELPAFASQWSAHDGFLQPNRVDGFDRGQADSLGHVRRVRLQTRPAGGTGSLPVGASLVHNGYGNLVRITMDDGTIQENFFQPSGLRYAKKVTEGGTVVDHRHFVYDDRARLLEEYDRSAGAPRLIARYYYAGSDAPEAADLWDPAARQLRRYYYLKEANESVIAVADMNGLVVERVWYDPFGQPMIERRDSEAPVPRRVIAGENGTLLVVMSESVFSAIDDPGSGSGIVAYPPAPSAAIAVTAGDETVNGSITWLAAVPGYPPYSVMQFTPATPLSGSVGLIVNAGSVVDDWGNPNAGQTISLEVGGPPGTTYYSIQPDRQTGPVRLARSSVGSPFMFQGQYFDVETGLVYLRARFYDPASGMFLEPDPLGYEDSVNHYAGMRNNPVGVRDPSGLMGEALFDDVVRLGARAVSTEEELKFAASTAKNIYGGFAVNAANRAARDPGKRAAIVSVLERIVNRSSMESGLINVVKPHPASLDMALRDKYIEIVRSPAFMKAVERYNVRAERWGLTKSVVDPELIVSQLENHTLFAQGSRKWGNVAAAFWDHSELSAIGKYWMQANPDRVFDFGAMSSGRATAVHELLHMGASIGGQLDQIRKVGKKGASWMGLKHEVAVQLASTPGTIGVWGTVLGGSIAYSTVAVPAFALQSTTAQNQQRDWWRKNTPYKNFPLDSAVPLGFLFGIGY
ncbi:MAG: hypothetical protein KJ072_02105, partial [Verrucomicrobia bacterium]|nr:hypothetical protein [Verrucomicrobiota bacterium]